MRDSLEVEIINMRQENPEVVTLYFQRPFDFVAGQYITVYIDGSAVSQGKAYSLSSGPREKLASITIKNVGGEFSSYLCSRQVGDRIKISSAYGNFNPQTDRPLVGLTAGCGLSPIWSVMSQGVQSKWLYFCHKSPEFTVFDRELAESDIRVQHFSTRQRVSENTEWKNGRFKVEKLIGDVPSDSHFLVCGSVDFVRSIWHDLEQQGVTTDRISTETFFE